jgi:hypothetical protein
MFNIESFNVVPLYLKLSRLGEFLMRILKAEGM